MSRKKSRWNPLKITIPPVARFLGIHLIKAEGGRAVCQMRMKHRHENVAGSVHGGVLCALADTTIGFAFASLLSASETGANIEFKINFFRPVFPRDSLRAQAKVLARGKSLFHFECEIRNSNGKLIAKVLSVCKAFPLPSIQGVKSET